MLTSFASTRWIIRAGLVLAGAASLAIACVTDERPRATCNELADGGVPIVLADALVYQGAPTTDAALLTQLAPLADVERLEDPGPRCTDCQQAADVEVLLVHDFEQAFAPTWFNYGEPGVPIQPQQVGFDAYEAGVPPPYWGLQVRPLAGRPGGERCGSKYALHMVGGPFLSWGGGYVSRSVTVRGREAIDKFCPLDTPDMDAGLQTGVGRAPEASNDSCTFLITPVAGQPSRLGLDVSDYEGISFWARRSPGAQSTLRIAVNDQSTAEGLAFEVERSAYRKRQADPDAKVEGPACRRALGCCRHCNTVERDAPILDGSTIVGSERVTEKRCWLEGERPAPELQMIDGSIRFRAYSLVEVPDGNGGTKREWTPGDWLAPGDYAMGEYRTAQDEYDRDAKLCCPPTMEQDSTNQAYAGQGDPQFGGRECNSYVFQYDYSSGYYCWAPGDPPLPERNENRCEDGFEMNVVVDTEWRFYKVPWGELRRLTPNRAAVDTTGIWSIGLFFGQGYLDTYVDDIGFYRRRR